MSEIVKVQLPLNEGNRSILVYNKDRSRMGIVPVSKSLGDLLNNQVKSFWHAEWHQGDLPQEGTYELIEPAPWQDW